MWYFCLEDYRKNECKELTLRQFFFVSGHHKLKIYVYVNNEDDDRQVVELNCTKQIELNYIKLN